MTHSPLPLLDADHADFIQSGVSISVGACDRNNRPALARAMGCLVDAALCQVRIFVSNTQASDLLVCVRENGALAVVYSQPSTHRTLQLKAIDASVLPLQDGDLLQIRRYRDLFARELQPLGFPQALVRTLLAAPPTDLIAVQFTPAEAWLQTPGPLAGSRLGKAS